jgi:hypothetical protein
LLPRRLWLVNTYLVWEPHESMIPGNSTRTQDMNRV